MLTAQILAVFALFLVLLVQLHAWNVEERCNTCSDVSDAFGEGLKRTRSSNFGGGNTAWEERKLGKFATSETRLVDVMEKLCQKARHSKLCHSMVEEQEEFIEKWWQAQVRASLEEAKTPKEEHEKVEAVEKSASEILRYKLCVTRLQICCPPLHFGDTCQACPSRCSEHGHCHGNGTRDGDGHCVCNAGYRGDNCENCHPDSHFRTAGSACEACNRACHGCTGASDEQCTKCAKGYTKGDKGDNHCVDINECSVGHGPCSPLREYCVNTAGAYLCRTCDIACEGCRGHGPDKCLGCAPGFEFDSKTRKCMDVNECAEDSEMCPGPNRVCRNTIGSYQCECEPGYQSDGIDCIKMTRPTKKGKGKNGKPLKKKRIWTKRYTREFLKYSAAIGALGLGSYLLKGRSVPVLVMAVACGVFVFWESIRLDNAFMRKKKL